MTTLWLLDSLIHRHGTQQAFFGHWTMTPRSSLKDLHISAVYRGARPNCATARGLLGIGRREEMPTGLASDTLGDRMKQRFAPPSDNVYLTAEPLARLLRSGGSSPSLCQRWTRSRVPGPIPSRLFYRQGVHLANLCGPRCGRTRDEPHELSEDGLTKIDALRR